MLLAPLRWALRIAILVVTVIVLYFAVTLVQVPASLSNADMRAGWMANRRCEQQAEALIKTASK